MSLIGALLHSAGLTENCRGCATQSLQFLKDLKSKNSLQRADPASVRIIIQKILHLGQVGHSLAHIQLMTVLKSELRFRDRGYLLSYLVPIIYFFSLSFLFLLALLD